MFGRRSEKHQSDYIGRHGADARSLATHTDGTGEQLSQLFADSAPEAQPAAAGETKVSTAQPDNTAAENALPENDTKKRPRRRAGKVWACAISVFVLLLAAAAAVYCVASLASFTLFSSEHLYITAGDEYIDPGVSCVYNGNDVSSEVVTQGRVDTMALGDYTITYRYRSPLGITYSAVRTVTVEDFKIPQLLLLGSENMFIGLGADYSEPGYTAVDNLDGDIAYKVVCSGSVDPQTPGEYTVHYSVTDSCGNTALATRVVTVSEFSPLTASLTEFSLDGYFANAVLAETPDAGADYPLSFTYLGDSFIANCGYFGVLPFSNIWCRESIHPFNVLTWTIKLFGIHKDITMVGAMEKYKPERVFILMGANCVAYCDPQEFAEAYIKFTDALLAVSPETQITLISVMPVLHRYDTGANSSRSINNTKINLCNYYLAQACSENGLYFLNAAEIFKDEYGAAQAQYFYSSDGIHLTTAGNRVLLQYIRTHALPED